MSSLKLSQELACNLLKEMNAKTRDIKAFQKGCITKTFYFPPLCRVDSINEEDHEVINRISEYGMMVYYVIPCFWKMNGVLIQMTSYLCVPKDIAQSTLGDIYHEMSNQQREDTVRDYIEQEMNAARDGYAYAYVVNKTEGFGEFGSIIVKSEKGILIRIG